MAYKQKSEDLKGITNAMGDKTTYSKKDKPSKEEKQEAKIERLENKAINAALKSKDKSEKWMVKKGLENMIQLPKEGYKYEYEKGGSIKSDEEGSFIEVPKNLKITGKSTPSESPEIPLPRPPKLGFWRGLKYGAQDFFTRQNKEKAKFTDAGRTQKSKKRGKEGPVT